MIRALYLLLATALLVSGCAEPCTPGVTAPPNIFGSVVVGLLESFWKVPASSPNTTCRDSDPGTGTNSLAGDAGRCAPATGDPDCVARLKASCCTETLECGADTACACLLTCRSAGNALDACSSACDAAPDDAYDAIVGCVDSSCAEQCPRLQ